MISGGEKKHLKTTTFLCVNDVVVMILYDVQQGAVLVDFVSPTYNSFSVCLCIMLHIELCGYSKILSCSFCACDHECKLLCIWLKFDRVLSV